MTLRQTEHHHHHSRNYIRIFNLIILLQLVLGAVAWRESVAIRRLALVITAQRAALVSAHERIEHLQQDLSSATSNLPDTLRPDFTARQELAEHLSASLLRLAELDSILNAREIAAAKAQAATFHTLAVSPIDPASFNQAVRQTSATSSLWQAAALRADSDIQHQLITARRAFVWMQCALALAPFFILAAVGCIILLKRDVRLEARQRQRVEDELRLERGTLEARIVARTVELQSEVLERQRAEQLNRGRNHLLEMLAREEPATHIFSALVDIITRDRSRWCCALYIIRGAELHLEASSNLPASLLRNLHQLPTSIHEVPALQAHKPYILEDLTRARTPWTQLLYANGIQSLWSAPIFAPDGAPLGILTIYSLLRCTPSQLDLDLLESHAQMTAMVLERYRLQQELRRHAYHDNLTGLPNRLLGEERLASAIRRGRRAGSPVAILWIDLDKFKQTNDVHGHVAGDNILKEIAARLSRRFRDSDTIARMGGDEFMAVLEDITDRSAARKIAEQLIAELALPIPFGDLMLVTEASIGISLFPEDGDSADLLQRNADMAMYEAKFGHHGVRAFSPALDSILTERRDLEKAMIHALDHGGFALHYQPQYANDGRLSAFEALLRFPHPVMGMVSPARLIPIAEESQMIVALGTWVLREACNQSMRWQKAGLPEVLIAVNISAMQFARQDFAHHVAEILEETGLHPELLELELTESVMVKDFAESTRQLERLKRLGVSIAVDDFGTGYSSLNHLHRLPIDKLKIDRSFIQALSEPNGTLPIVESIIAMAHRMGMCVVAEGVETPRQMATLREKSCNILQGYLFSPPVEADRAALFLATGTNPRLTSAELTIPALPSHPATLTIPAPARS
ncbi:putative bifunctional diguanylate cyclase/phosphodiesterase [Granulicella tundricola]|uniref:Diguanylate cyclase/phosphodiesterase n=1 Tax=Granulicella tundricola (strain ATCC BAA-1859 / DSM 23138 / MP5ACTX9) TaxID=1198114 RepID=E8X6I1_GRATM|nr:EAL domain-containing protein [Granulicella tundricola]ADW71065.1 diguanylate cyclase/phosphodiesterase [Granulicella tundricola MP5ACTX9]